jgi:hypothetical protein
MGRLQQRPVTGPRSRRLATARLRLFLSSREPFVGAHGWRGGAQRALWGGAIIIEASSLTYTRTLAASHGIGRVS